MEDVLSNENHKEKNVSRLIKNTLKMQWHSRNTRATSEIFNVDDSLSFLEYKVAVFNV